jgi:hypothetical protein
MDAGSPTASPLNRRRRKVRVAGGARDLDLVADQVTHVTRWRDW